MATLFEMIHMTNKKNSQSGQDGFVINYFNSKHNGVFVDIGANDGITLSNTYYLEKTLNWDGVCFEPIPTIFEKLDKIRKCEKVNAAIAESNGFVKFSYVDGPLHMLSGITDKYDPRHLDRIKKDISIQGGAIQELTIPTVTFNETMSNFFDKRSLPYKIDYLSLDTEGNELGILKTIDFEKFDIKVMSIENNYFDNNLTNFVLSKGYVLHGRLEADEIFVKRNLKK